MTSHIFNARETLMAIGGISELRRGARGTVLRIVAVVIAVCCVVPLGALDYEVYFRIFEFMTEQSGDHWSPRLMGCVPAIMLVAFHLLAKKSPNHVVVKLVGALTGFFVLAFIVGGGLYISALLYLDAGAPSEAALPLPPLGGVPPVGEIGSDQGWLDMLFNNVTSPVGVLVMSLGIGGLSVVSVYAGHQLLSIIEHNVREVHAARRTLREGLAHYRACQDAEARFGELALEHERLMRCREDQLLVQIAGRVLQTINTHVIPHEMRLQRMRFETVETRLDHDPSAEIKRVASAVKTIRDISLADVLNALSPRAIARSSK